MLLASLIDAGADRLAVMDAWGALGVDGFAATWERVQRCGVASLWTNLAIDATTFRTTEDVHDHSAAAHPHRPAAEVLTLIEGAELPARVKRDAVAVYRRLAEVEGSIHGTDPDEVELHEVGALDSILDVVGVCAALHDLGIERIEHSPVAVGHGTVSTGTRRAAQSGPGRGPAPRRRCHRHRRARHHDGVVDADRCRRVDDAR